EQLGGYEKAKAFLNAASYTIDELIMMQRSGLRPQHVEKALLEYRRQHNIFEVGDWVFPRAKGSGFRAMQIKKITKTFIYANHLILNVEHWRHATNAEIEAGKRSEVV
ncbi:hypothetical protein, partial [Acinetobacter sp. UBA6007]|uniref:hypothetical protein n=1 Tax=Acinetobacter sp. UBA6007 TaxID=1945949 RepID=UPI00257F6DB5